MKTDTGIIVPSGMQHKSVLYGKQSFDPFFQVKAVDDGKGIIQAYASKFDNIDEYKDVVVSGAYTRTLNNQHKAGRKYLYVYLFQHDPNLIVGGISEAEQDKAGLLYQAQCNLDTQLGRETYSNAKMGVLYQSSIGYDVPAEGYEYKDGLRYLKEIRLWEISLVTFAANPEATVVDVKQNLLTERPYEIQTKSVCGSTSGPIGPRDESWDGAAAKKWIWGKALDADGKVKSAVAKKYFMRMDGDSSEKGSYSYPFWVDDHISVGGVKAVAGALEGARNADPGGDEAGMRRKVETLYNRINKKYPDAEQLTPVWEDSSKSREDDMQTKDLAAHYNEAMAADLLEDWQDVYLCALTCAMLDALKEGSDVGKVLDDFKTLIMEKFVPQSEDVGLSDYLEEHTYSSSPAEYSMQYGNDSKPNYGGYMSSSHARDRKAGRAISATNQDKIQSHVDGLHDIADTHMKAMKTAYKAMQDHTKAIHTAADDLATVIQGSEAAYGTDPGNAGDQQEGKSATSHNARGTQEHSSSADTVNEDEISTAIRQLRSLKIAN